MLKEGKPRVEDAPEEIWLPTYGTDHLFDDWWEEQASDNDVRYIRADIHEQQIAELKEAIQEIKEWVPGCNCHEAYTERSLFAPDCQYHSSGFYEVEGIVNAALKGEPIPDEFTAYQEDSQTITP